MKQQPYIQTHTVILVSVALFTFVNILISAYMTYMTLNIALRKCDCAVFNAYWVIIFLYFLFSGIFLVYSFLVTFGALKGYKFMYFVIGYIISTGIFVVGSYYYTKYLESKKCKCVSGEYTHTLKVITYVRLLLAAVSTMALLIWGIYLILKNSFMLKR